MSKAKNVYENVQGKIDKLASELSDFRYDMENFQSECDAARCTFSKTDEKRFFKMLAKIIKTTNKNAEREQKIIKLMAKLLPLMTDEMNEES